MNYIVFDLEFNEPQYETTSKLHSEIIEIGAVKLNEEFEVIDTFRIFVKPFVYKSMSNRTKRITNINAEHLENYSFPFQICINYFIKWIGNEFVLCSWSYSDIKVLLDNCSFYKIDFDFNRYVDLQYVYAKENNLDNRFNSLETALSYLNILLDKNFHFALNDSKYASIILQKYKNNINNYTINYMNNERYMDIQYITNIRDNRINKKHKINKCIKCGKFLNIILKWKRRNKSMISLTFCKNCEKYFYNKLKVIIKINGKIDQHFTSKEVSPKDFSNYINNRIQKESNAIKKCNYE